VNKEPLVLSKNFEKENDHPTIFFSGFLGILTIINYKFILMAEEVERVVEFLGHEIYKISKLAFIPYEVFLN
jgi:hypothetical protein